MKNVPYLGDPALVEVYPQAQGCLESLVKLGFELFVVSNQSGVGRGLITPQQVEAVNSEMNRQLGRNYFRRIYSCYEEPQQGGIYQRKPSPQLLFEAAREYGLDLANSYFVGDRLTDILAGRNAGCRTILVLSGEAAGERPLSSCFAGAVRADLSAVEALIRQEKVEGSSEGGAATTMTLFSSTPSTSAC